MERFEPYTVHRTQSWAKGHLVHTENDDHEDNYNINYISINIKKMSPSVFSSAALHVEAC